jgi:hypothetical protein
VFLFQLGLYFKHPEALAFALDVEDMVVNGAKIASWSVLVYLLLSQLGKQRSQRLTQPRRCR